MPARAVVVAGATDGCAAFLATGVDKPGEAVTSLGSTLVLKLASEQPLFAPEYGLYSHLPEQKLLLFCDGCGGVPDFLMTAFEW